MRLSREQRELTDVPWPFAYINLEGKKFGRLTPQWPSGRVRTGNTKSRVEVVWLCSCDCGRLTNIKSCFLRSGKTRSCGCLKIEFYADPSKHLFGLRHGRSRQKGKPPDPTWDAWQAMHGRCNTNNPSSAKRYKDCGIVICGRWSGKGGFENFLADMGEKPPGLTLDRYPNNKGNYEPGNCRWGTQEQQANNRTNNVTLTLDGVTMTVSQWARKAGIPRPTLKSRLERGWNVRDAVTRVPLARYQKKDKVSS